MKLELIAFTRRGEALAERLAGLLCRTGHQAACTREGLRVEDWAVRAFQRSEGLVFVGAAGIAVRAIAPCVCHKSLDPAVVVLDEGGRFVIPILSGHLGGANDLAREIAGLLDAQAVITTATDVNGVFSVDQWARRQNLAVCNPEKILAVSSALLAGKSVTVWSRWPVAGQAPAGLCPAGREEAEVVVDWIRPGAEALWLCPRTIRLGMGCRRGTAVETLERAALAALDGVGLPQQGVSRICTIDRKGDEPGLLALCRAWKIPLTTYSEEELAGVPGEFPASEFVRQITGVDNVCQRAALAEGGELLMEKRILADGVTAALAALPPRLTWEEKQ